MQSLQSALKLLTTQAAFNYQLPNIVTIIAIGIQFTPATSAIIAAILLPPYAITRVYHRRTNESRLAAAVSLAGITFGIEIAAEHFVREPLKNSSCDCRHFPQLQAAHHLHITHISIRCIINIAEEHATCKDLARGFSPESSP